MHPFCIFFFFFFALEHALFFHVALSTTKQWLQSAPERFTVLSVEIGL